MHFGVVVKPPEQVLPHFEKKNGKLFGENDHVDRHETLLPDCLL